MRDRPEGSDGGRGSEEGSAGLTSPAGSCLCDRGKAVTLMRCHTLAVGGLWLPRDTRWAARGQGRVAARPGERFFRV